MDTLSITLEIDDNGANAVLTRTEQKVDNFVNKVSGANPKINISIGDKGFIELDKLEKKAEATRKQFASLVQFNPRDNSLDGLSQSAIRLQQETSRANARVRETQKILSEYKGSNQSLFKVLSEDARAAERDLARLETRSTELEKRLVQRGGTPNAGGGANNLKFSAFQKQNLFYQANDIATMASLGANPLQIIASQAGQIAQIPTAAQASALVAAYAPLVGILGAGAAALLLTYKITGDIRAEAEKRLKIETMISATVNKYILGQQEIIKNNEKLLVRDASDRSFSSYLDSASIDELKRKKAFLQEVQLNTSPTTPTLENGKFVDKQNEEYDRRTEQIRRINAQIAAAEQQSSLEAKNSFNQRWESYKKSQESSMQAELRQIDALEAKKKKIDETIKKVEEYGKAANSILSGTFSNLARNNPISQTFLDGERAVDALNEKLKETPERLKYIVENAINVQRQMNAENLFAAKIDNNLAAFDLRERANQFRNAGNAEAYKKLFDDAVSGDISRGNFFGGAFGTYGAFLANKAGGADKLTDAQRRDIYEVGQLKNLSTFDSSKFGVNDNSLLSRLARERAFGNGDENLSFNERLQKQLSIIYGGANSDDEKAIADKRFIGLTSSLDPLRVSSDLREKIAMANEREAGRKAEYEKEDLKLRREQKTAMENLTTVLNDLKTLAQKGENVAPKQIVEIVDKTNGKTNILGASPVPSDMDEIYGNIREGFRNSFGGSGR